MTEYPIIKNSEDYPETLSWDQFDHIGWKFIKDVNDSFYDNKNNRSSTSNAAEFACQAMQANIPKRIQTFIVCPPCRLLH